MLFSLAFISYFLRFRRSSINRSNNEKPREAATLFYHLFFFLILLPSSSFILYIHQLGWISPWSCYEHPGERERCSSFVSNSIIRPPDREKEQQDAKSNTSFYLLLSLLLPNCSASREWYCMQYCCFRTWCFCTSRVSFSFGTCSLSLILHRTLPQHAALAWYTLLYHIFVFFILTLY